MKRIYLLICLLLAACGFTAYLWRAEISNNSVINASLDKAGENSYYINLFDKNKFSVLELDAAGNITPKLELPKELSSGINLRWVSDHAFFAMGMFGEVAFVSFDEGIHWRLSNAEFSAVAGRSIHISPYYSQLTPQGSLLAYGGFYIMTNTGTWNIGGQYLAEINQQGEITHFRMTEGNNVTYRVQAMNDSYVLFSQYSQQLQEQTGLSGLLHSYNWQHELIRERAVNAGQQFKLAVNNDLYFAQKIGNLQETISIQQWDGSVQREIPIGIYDFTSSGQIKLTAQSELLLVGHFSAEKYTLAGEKLLSQHPASLATKEGLYTNGQAMVYAYSYGREQHKGVGLEVSHQADGSVLFRGYGQYYSWYQFAYEVLVEDSDKPRIVTQASARDVYQIEHDCLGNESDWCFPGAISKEPGVCKIYDVELVDGKGGFITLTKHCGAEAAEDKLTVTRY